MANKKRDVYKPKPMTEGKKAVIQGLLNEYDIQTADDIQEALKDLLSVTIQSMLEAEINEHLGYEKYERDDEPNYRNGTKPKTVRSKYGEFEVDVPHDGIVSKLAAYIVLGINEDGMKEVLSIEIGENESSKYWLSVLNSLKNRGVQDILILCSDGLTGLKEAIQAAFPSTEHQRCIVHMVRNTLKYVANKDMKAFAKDLKTLYTASDEKAALKRLDEVTKKWQPLYPHAMNRWHDNWDVITPIFKFSMDVRTAFYTTNAIESLNSCYRRLNKQRSVFPSSQALMKALYLATFEITKKWTMPIRNWGRVRGELSIMYPGRFSD